MKVSGTDKNIWSFVITELVLYRENKNLTSSHWQRVSVRRKIIPKRPPKVTKRHLLLLWQRLFCNYYQVPAADAVVSLQLLIPLTYAMNKQGNNLLAIAVQYTRVVRTYIVTLVVR